MTARRTAALTLVAIALPAALRPGVAAATETTGCEVDKILASDADALDGFGEHISVHGDVAIVGAWNDEDTARPTEGFSFGSAYILRRIGGVWMEEQKLLPSDPESEKRFGHDVAIDGDTVVIGAVGASVYSGAVYFYARTDGVWGGEQKVTPDSPNILDEFGFSVAIDGDVAIVGAPGDDEGCGDGCNGGAAYIIRNTNGTWNVEQKIVAADVDIQDRFGWAVAIRGDTAMVTSRVDDDQGTSTGSVWVYEFDGETWRQVQKLHAPDAGVGDLFGHSMAMGDGIVAVGAIQDDDACPDDILCNSGSVYVFRFDEGHWVYESKLVAADGAEDDEFGNAVAVEDDVVIVGARWNDDACPQNPECESGSAYVFRTDGASWSQEGKLVASDTAQTDYFGVDVALSGPHALVGSYLDDDEGTACGAMYVYDLSPDACACPADVDGSGAVGVADLLAILGAWGTSDGDVTGDGTTDVADVLALLDAWGPCD